MIQQNSFPSNYVMELQCELNLFCFKTQICTRFVLTRFITSAFHAPLAHQSAWFEDHEVVSASKRIHHVHKTQAIHSFH